jgi:hypothetical protein
MDDNATKVRKVIRDSLLELADKLGDFEQSCVVYHGNWSIKSVAQELERCYDSPNISSVSFLVQVIHQLEE